VFIFSIVSLKQHIIYIYIVCVCVCARGRRYGTVHHSMHFISDTMAGACYLQCNMCDNMCSKPTAFMKTIIDTNHVFVGTALD
jgi:hypothetical protein